MWKPMIMGALMMCLCGCIKDKDELTLNADGSGKVRIETQCSLPPEMAGVLAMQGRMGGAAGVVYPPVSEAEARKFFPPKDFQVAVTQQRATNGEVTTVVTAEFKDINALLASPYGQAHQLTAQISGGALVIRGVTGMEAAARMAEIKDDTGMMAMQMPGYADLQKNKGEMRAEFRITLPNAITDANGSRDGKTAAWVVERAKCKDADEFARQLGAVCEARCPADGLKISPASPVRMGLVPFAELAAGVTSAGSSVDTNKIAAAAKFVPYGLTVTRSLDLSGEGGTQENAAQLTGAVTVPAEFAPQKWGDVKLDEVVDAKGNDLKPADSDARNSFMRYSSYSNMRGDDEDAATNNIRRHVVSIAFRPPDWKVNEITRIKGSASLQYFGGSQLVKLTNAIPAGWIASATGMMAGRLDPSEKLLNSEALSALGLTLSLQMGMEQAGMTILMLQTQGTQAALLDAQVFDADGHPWPTFLQKPDFGMGEGSTSQIMIAGKPQPPLSLALQVSGSGAAVEVPVLVEHVMITK